MSEQMNRTIAVEMEMETEEIVEVLEVLSIRTSSPVVAECLRETIDDIKHLTSSGNDD